METTLGFNVEAYKQIFSEAPTKANGWEIVTEGPIKKDTPRISIYFYLSNFSLDCTAKIYKKVIEGATSVSVRTEAILKGVDAAKLHKLLSDIHLNTKGDPLTKSVKVVEQLSPNSDVVHIEVTLPFPLSNREFLVKRIYFNNKDNVDLVKKLGLYQKDHIYYVIMVESTMRPEYPVKSSPVRGHTKMLYWLIEEDPKDKNTARAITISSQDIGGNVPLSLQNKAVPQKAHEAIERHLTNYINHFGKV